MSFSEHSSSSDYPAVWFRELRKLFKDTSPSAGKEKINSTIFIYSEMVEYIKLQPMHPTSPECNVSTHNTFTAEKLSFHYSWAGNLLKLHWTYEPGEAFSSTFKVHYGISLACDVIYVRAIIPREKSDINVSAYGANHNGILTFQAHRAPEII